MAAPERLRILEAAVREEPNDPVGHFLLGIEYQQLGRHEDAAGAYRRAIELKEDYTAAYRELGKTLRDAGHREQALEVFRRGISVAGRTHDVQTRKEMEVFLRRLLEPNPDQPRT